MQKESLEKLEKAIKERKPLKMFINGDYIDDYYFENGYYQGKTFFHIELEDLFELIESDSGYSFEVLE